MAVIKAVSSKAGIGQALDYVTKEEKTEDKLVSGLHCEPDTVKDEMQATKELWGKTGGRTYKHFVHSYHEDEHITPEQAHKNAIELAKGTEAWKGHEVLIATHIDRGHIHTHFIVNSVNFEDGHKLQWSKAELQNLKDRCNEQSRQQGLHVPEKGKTFSGEEREETVAWNKETYNLLKQAEKGEVKSYVQDTALAVMDCREIATSREDFIDQMKARGYGVDWQDSHKYITFTDLERQSQGEKQCKVRNNKLEKYYAVDFGKESLEHGFEINARREAERTATTERARQQLDRTAVAENSGADERARARQLLDRTAVTEDSRTGKAYQPDNTAVTEERLSNLRSYQPSRGMESQGRPGTDQGKRPGTETTGRTTEPQKDLAEERLASLRSHKPSRGMEEPSREIGDTISAVRADKDLWGEGEIDRPELKMAYARIKIAESSKKLTDAKYKPQFYIGVDGSYSAPGYDFRSDLDPNYAIYAKVSVPLFEWGKRRDEKRASSFKVGMATDYLNQVTDQVKLEVETARVSLSQTMEQVRLTEGSLSKAFENERMALERYTEGKASVIEVIEAQTYRQEGRSLDWRLLCFLRQAL